MFASSGIRGLKHVVQNNCLLFQPPPLPVPSFLFPSLKCLLLNGNIAVSGSWDSSIRVWSAPYGVCRLVLTGHTQGRCGHHGFVSEKW